MFRLVLFHQSLPGASPWPPEVPLTSEERLQFCDLKFYSLMKLVMLADAASYNFLDPENWAILTKEFIASNDAMV